MISELSLVLLIYNDHKFENSILAYYFAIYLSNQKPESS